MITQFCVDDNGYIVQDTVPRDEDGNVIEPFHLNAVSYDYDLLNPMDRPKYNFTTKLFEDEGIDYDYWIDLMNAESDPVLKEEYRMKAYFMIRLIAFFVLWSCENNLLNKDKILNNLTQNSLGEYSIVYKRSDDYFYKKSLLFPYTETKLSNTKIYGKLCYVGNNKIVFTDNAQRRLYIKSLTSNEDATLLLSQIVFDWGMTYIGNDEVCYTLESDLKLYKININTLTVTPITNFQAICPCFVGNNTIIYIKYIDNFLYKYNISTSTETLLTNNNAIDQPCFIGNNKIVYRHSSSRLYIMNLITGISTALTPYSAFMPCYIGGNELIYSSGGAGLYKINIETYNISQILDYIASYPCYIGNIYCSLVNYNNYYTSIYPELISFIKTLDKIQLNTTSELNDFYTSTQILREKYNIYALENIKEISGYTENNKNWLEQMNNILGED